MTTGSVPQAQHFRQNHLLAALAERDIGYFSTELELMSLPLGKSLYVPGEQMQHAYFPTTAVVSLHYVTDTGAAAESAGVGNEGLVGVPLYLGGNTIPSSAVVHTAGHAYRLDRRVLKNEFDRAGQMQRVLLRYTQALITQITQASACYRHHSIEQQLCRWLLLTIDRAPMSELVMTQELIANLLGVRREGITSAAGKLQEAGYIRYRRGHIAVLNRGGLEKHTCECYGVVKKELFRLLNNID